MRLSIFEGLSVDLSVSLARPVPTTRDNLVALAARTLVNNGGRYRFKLAGEQVNTGLPFGRH
ncbi:hypothetical protein [Sphingomonas sp. LaA6.9]|uniref:hypothetical protein n=1 Tax=Sphingomonas sp. LaA6.9 TaxID=2919914 RepID=UPI001F500D5D|nr:hypothetical protein [Sphingomonas sp. LaA6.9]MCJ8158866.1 hypothetical protein [Sphingomonas sp. LaA6.9]